MRIGICGFIKYVKLIFQYAVAVHYVPMAHSNTSSIESLFSLMRAHGGDTPQLYQSRISNVDASKSMMHLSRNNKMYEATEEDGKCIRSVDYTTGRFDGHR